jgi:tripartite-type tricarboxylate transporter receptor subunit TctC
MILGKTEMTHIIGRIALALALLMSLAASPQAQDYPNRPVKIVVPYPPGGSNDVIARILAQRLSEELKQQFIVENRAGANGNVGAAAVATGDPDGYTLLLTAPGPLTINQSLYSKLSFDPLKDFAPVALVASVPIVLMVHPDVKATNVKDLIALAQAQPGKLNFGSSGIGSTNHLAGELLKRMAKVDIVHVAYKGAAPAMNDLVGGHIPIMFDNMPAALPQVSGNKVRALAVAGAKRAESMPNVPTVAESGLPDFEASAWFGLVAPAKTPTAVLAKLTDAVNKALTSSDVVKRFRELGAEPGSSSGAAYSTFLKAETNKWADVIRASGAKAE